MKISKVGHFFFRGVQDSVLVSVHVAAVLFLGKFRKKIMHSFVKLFKHSGPQRWEMVLGDGILNL